MDEYCEDCGTELRYLERRWICPRCLYEVDPRQARKAIDPRRREAHKLGRQARPL
jgi:predicted amidophosphoribosyltransferase